MKFKNIDISSIYRHPYIYCMVEDHISCMRESLLSSSCAAYNADWYAWLGGLPTFCNVSCRWLSYQGDLIEPWICIQFAEHQNIECGRIGAGRCRWPWKQIPGSYWFKKKIVSRIFFARAPRMPIMVCVWAVSPLVRHFFHGSLVRRYSFYIPLHSSSITESNRTPRVITLDPGIVGGSQWRCSCTASEQCPEAP